MLKPYKWYQGYRWYHILGVCMLLGPFALAALGVIVWCLQESPGELLFVTGFLTWMCSAVYLIEKQ